MTLPHDPKAEAAILGCCLLSPAECLPPVREALAPESFYDLRHRTLFQRITAMHRAGDPIDPTTLYSALKLAGEIESAGGLAYFSTLPDLVVSTANLPAYLESVQKHAVTRQVSDTATEILDQLQRSPECANTIVRVAARTFTELHRLHTGKAAAEPSVADAADLIDIPRETPPEIISGVLHRGSKLVLGGGSKSYKTWTLLDLGLSVSHGVPWIGFPTRKGRVLYVNLEIQEDFFLNRVRQVCSAKAITLEHRQFYVLNLRGHCAEFGLLLPKVEEDARARGCDLIVLDPIYKLYGATDENSAGDVARLLNGLERLAVTTGAAVAFGAHFSKGNQAGKESIDRISGSGVFARDPDSILILTRHEEKDAYTLESTLRNLPPLDPFVVRWTHPVMSRDEQLDPGRLKKLSTPEPRMDPAKILNLLPPNGLTYTEWKALATEIGASSAGFDRLRTELKETGKVRQDSATRRWIPTSVSEELPSLTALNEDRESCNYQGTITEVS